jgi:predicted nucleic acid-binding protein
MYLLDTNILLELLLNRQHAAKVMQFLSSEVFQCQVSDFSFHSIGLHLFTKNKKALFSRFAKDIFKQGGLRITSLSPDYVPLLVEISDTYELDFDDAYQYAIIQSQDLILISYDKDFDRTPHKRKTPEDIINQ